MPVSFTPAPSFGPRTACARTRARPKKKSPKKKGNSARVLTSQVRTVLIDRIEAAIDCGRVGINPEDMASESLDFTLAELALLLRILLPEEYLDPSEGRGPASPTRTAPGSAERIAEYAARAAAGRAITVAGDATAHGAHDRGLAISQRRNGSGVRVVGWGDGG
jgi:hypothetical protein